MPQNNRKTATITLTFEVSDEALLVKLADQAIESHGNGVETNKDAPLAFRILELLLHSNPDINSYRDYGIDLLNESLVDQVIVPTHT